MAHILRCHNCGSRQSWALRQVTVGGGTSTRIFSYQRPYFTRRVVAGRAAHIEHRARGVPLLHQLHCKMTK